MHALESLLNNTENIDLTTGYNNQIKMLQCGEILLKHLNENNLPAAFCAIHIPNVHRSSLYGGANKSLNIWQDILDVVNECLPQNAYLGRVHIGLAMHIWGDDIENKINIIFRTIQSKLEKFDLCANNEQVALHLTLTSEIGYVVYPNDTGYLNHYKSLTYYAALSTTRYDNIDYPSHIKRFSQDNYKNLKEKISTETSLIRCINENDFKLLYQPLINLKTKKVFAAEALVTFDNYDLDIKNTGEYISIIENSKYITDFTQKSFTKFVDFLIQYQNQLPNDFRIGFNLSRAIFKWKDFNLCNMIKHTLQDHEHLSKNIQIELTESAYFSKELFSMVFDTVKELDQLGITVAIDDFGSGYGSLNMLTSGLLNTIKLDMQITQNICNQPNNNAFLLSLLYAAKSTNLHIVAEGIESKEDEEKIFALGVYLVQGYQYSRKIEGAHLIDFINTY